MAKLSKRKPGPPLAPVTTAPLIQQQAPNLEYTRYVGLLPDTVTIFAEPVLFVGKPQGEFIRQCAFMLTSQQVGYTCNFYSGLRYVDIWAGTLPCYGDCKRNCRNASETGQTLVAVFTPGRPGCRLLFTTARPYARKLAKATVTYAQRFFREYMRPRLAAWLQAVPVEAQLS